MNLGKAVIAREGTEQIAPVRLTYGVVTQASPLLVRVGAATTSTGMAQIVTYSAVAGDFVAIVEQGADRLCIGRPVSQPVAYRYFRWRVTENRNLTPANYVQASEFNLLLAGGIRQPTTAQSGQYQGVGQEPSKLDDNNTATKWLTTSVTAHLADPILLDLGAAYLITGYRWSTANDSTDRDPVSWTLEGSTDSTTWVLVDSVASWPTTTDRLTPAFARTFFASAERTSRVVVDESIAACSGGVTLSAVNQNITGAAITYTGTTGTTAALRVGDVVTITGVFDVQQTVAAAGVATLGLAVTSPVAGTVNQAAIATYQNNFIGGRATVVQQWRFVVASSGVHTFQLIGSIFGTLGYQVNVTHTTIATRVTAAK